MNTMMVFIFLLFTTSYSLLPQKNSLLQNDLALAATINSSVNPNHLIEENRKTVNDIYLQAAIANKTEFDLAQITILESIACQDPLEGGDAVYSARVMLRNMDPCQSLAKMAFVTDEVGEESKPNLQNEKIYSIGKIYPNPNDGTMQLDYVLENEQNGNLLIFDITGRKITEYLLSSDKKTLQLNKTNLQDGVYFYEIIVNDETMTKDKLLIIK